MHLIFATNNQNKIQEISSILNTNIELITLKQAGINIDIPEPFNTIEQNASNKSRVIFNLTDTNCFSEDSGIEVEALDWEPGVHSAYYAGPERSDVKNIEKLLKNLEHKTNRNARFKTVISLIINGEESLFEGICPGKIISKRKGNNGFGYDPVFIPTGSDKTFAEMDMAEKNKFSHRKKAMEKLINFLNK